MGYKFTNEMKRLIEIANEGLKAQRLLKVKYREFVTVTSKQFPEIDQILIRQYKIRGTK